MPLSNGSPKTLAELVARACDAYGREYNAELAGTWKAAFGSVPIAELYQGLVAHQRNTSPDPRNGRPVGRWFPTAADILAQVDAAHRRDAAKKAGTFGRPYCGGPQPIELVVVKGATKRTRKPRNLMVEQFQRLSEQLKEPFRTMALMCVCFGLRISECLALRWSDVDWLNGRLQIERGIVEQHVDEVKTDSSRRSLTVASELLQRLRVWKQATQFPADGDWIFASPLKNRRLPYSYTGEWRELQRAADAAGIGHLGTHAFRHTYRSWLDAVGTPIAVQQKLMRHSDIRTTMNIYGDIVTDEMAVASSKVAGLALKSA